MTEYLTENSSLPPYMACPRFLLGLAISDTAKLVYMLLLDRARLSMQNDGWVDESGHVFLYYTVNELAATLARSDMTIKTALKVLAEQGLLIRQRQGAGKANRIYVKIPPQTERNLSVRGKENFTIEGKKTVPQTERKLSLNNKEDSNNKEIKRWKNKPSAYGSCHNVLLTEQERTALQADYPDCGQRIERLSSYMASSGKTYKNHAATIRLWAAKDKPAPAPGKRTYECTEDESL